MGTGLMVFLKTGLILKQAFKCGRVAILEEVKPSMAVQLGVHELLFA